MKKLIAVVLILAGTAAAAQAITWRLVGSQFNVGAGSMTCIYEGRLSNGNITHVTTIVPGHFCPTAPGARF